MLKLRKKIKLKLQGGCKLKKFQNSNKNQVKSLLSFEIIYKENQILYATILSHVIKCIKTFNEKTLQQSSLQ